MTDLNIRNVDPDLVQKVNVLAAQAGITQREFVIGVMRAAISRNVITLESSTESDGEKEVMPNDSVGKDLRSEPTSAVTGEHRAETSANKTETYYPCPRCESPLEFYRDKWGCRECDQTFDIKRLKAVTR